MPLLKTPVERIDAYYLGRKDGMVELCDMHQIDFDQASEAHPKDWSLDLPPGRKVIDKRERPFVLPQFNQKPVPGPPVVERDPNLVRDIIRVQQDRRPTRR